ncbi:MAG: DUF1801 domain-containing protein [Bacteroidota bacterium]
MSEVEDFIYEREGEQRAILLYLHHLFTMDLGLESKIRYRIPFYFGRSWICYTNPIKEEAIELVFLRGNELSNAQGILESKGRKQVSGITFSTLKEISEETLLEVLQEAIVLDETIPYASKRKKG